MDTASLFVFASALFIAAIIPGPSMTALIAHILARGNLHVFVFATALTLGDALWLTFAVWGLAAVAQTFYLLFVVIKWAGIAYLLYLAWHMWKSPVSQVEITTHNQKTTVKGMLMTGFAITLGNPKTMMFYVAFLPSIIDVRYIRFINWLELLAIELLIVGGVYVGVIFAAMQLRRVLKSARAMRVANRTGAVAMAGAAGVLATR